MSSKDVVGVQRSGQSAQLGPSKILVSKAQILAAAPFFTAEAANASHLSHRVHGVFSQIRGATQVQLLLDPHLVRFNSLAAYS